MSVADIFLNQSSIPQISAVLIAQQCGSIGASNISKYPLLGLSINFLFCHHKVDTTGQDGLQRKRAAPCSIYH